MLLEPEQKTRDCFMRFHLVYIQVTNQMMYRHERDIHYYIQWLPDQSKQIQGKYWKNILGQQNKAHQVIAKLLARKIVSMKTLYEDHSSKRYQIRSLAYSQSNPNEK